MAENLAGSPVPDYEERLNEFNEVGAKINEMTIVNSKLSPVSIAIRADRKWLQELIQKQETAQKLCQQSVQDLEIERKERRRLQDRVKELETLNVRPYRRRRFIKR